MHKKPTQHTESHSIMSENGPQSPEKTALRWAVGRGQGWQNRRKPTIVRVSLNPCYSGSADPNQSWASDGAASGFRAYPDSCTVVRVCLH